ncbi:MAG: two-component system, NtrC family, nitrogen regulation response regulator NtrX [Acidimicrobiaceae bacterium]
MISTGSRIRVLLIDDDAKMVALVRNILTDEGYEVVGRTTATDVLGQIEALDPHVVVLDEVMPDLDGLDVAEEIRELRPNQPIVIFSSLFDQRLSRETQRRGYVYCEKADGIDRLEEAIKEAVGDAP